MARTAFAQGNNPWTGLAPEPRPAPQKPTLVPKNTIPKADRKPANYIDPDADLEICDDPMPLSVKRTSDGKYTAKFKSLKPGQSLKVAPENVGRVSGALRKYAESLGPKGKYIVRHVNQYPGDASARCARVWLLEAKP